MTVQHCYKTMWLMIVVFFSTAVFALDPFDEGSVERITDDPITLDIHFHYHDKYNATYNNDWPVEKLAGRLTGVSLSNVTPGGIEHSTDAFNLMMAGDKLPDIVGGTDLRQKFNQYGPQGVFLPLNKLIEQHAPNIHQYFKNHPQILSAVSAGDGKLYHIPYIPDGKFGRAYFIRTDWLKKLGLSVPETVDDLYKVLVAFRDRDPNGNGLKDEVPYFSRTIPEIIRLVTLWDARTSGTDKANDFYIKDNTVKHGFVEPDYRIGIQNLAKWYEEGLIHKDYFNNSRDNRNYMLTYNLGGMTHDWFASTAGYNDRLKKNIQGFELTPIAPPASVSGKRIEEHRRSSVKPDGWAITRENQFVIETIKYFDFWFTPFGRRLANFGVANSEYTLVSGNPVFKDELLQHELPVNERLWSVGAQLPRGFVQDYEYEKQWTNKIALRGIELYESGDFLVEPFHGVTLNKTEKEVFDTYWNEILGFMLERQEEWVVGLRDVNRDWDSYLTRLDKLGYQKVMSVMQSAYKRQYLRAAVPDSFEHVSAESEQ